MLAVLVSWFIWFIPLVNRYRFPIQAIGVLTLCVGAFLSGGVGVNEMWQARVKELEDKIAIAESKSAEANTEIKTVYVDRVRVVHDVQEKIVTEIREVEKKIDAECKVDQVAIDILNRAADDPAHGKDKK
jgi:hypothetical protein